MLRARVTLRDDGIVVYRELPILSIFALDVVWSQYRALTAHLDSFATLTDLTESNRPSAEFRVHLKELIRSTPKLERMAVFTGRNFLLNIAARFVFSGMVDKPFTVHRTFEEALEALQRGR